MSKQLGYAQEAALAAAKPLPGLTAARDDPNTGDNRFIGRVLIQAEGQSIRWRDDGVDPTAAIGMLIPVNTVVEFDGDLDKFRMIETAASAKANCTYYGL